MRGERGEGRGRSGGERGGEGRRRERGEGRGGRGGGEGVEGRGEGRGGEEEGKGEKREEGRNGKYVFSSKLETTNQSTGVRCEQGAYAEQTQIFRRQLLGGGGVSSGG